MLFWFSNIISSSINFYLFTHDLQLYPILEILHQIKLYAMPYALKNYSRRIPWSFLISWHSNIDWSYSRVCSRTKTSPNQIRIMLIFTVFSCYRFDRKKYVRSPVCPWETFFFSTSDLQRNNQHLSETTNTFQFFLYYIYLGIADSRDYLSKRQYPCTIDIICDDHHFDDVCLNILGIA